MISTREDLIFRIATSDPGRIRTVESAVDDVNEVIDKVIDEGKGDPLVREAVRRLVYVHGGESDIPPLQAVHLAAIADAAYDLGDARAAR